MPEEFFTPLQEYEKARKMAQKQYRSSVSAGKYPYLPALDDMLPYEDIVSESYLGIVDIPLDQIAGTRRQAVRMHFPMDFCHLFPPKSEFGSKWINLYQAQLNEGIGIRLKPYEFMNKFYIQEGNKRVSVLELCAGQPVFMAM